LRVVVCRPHETGGSAQVRSVFTCVAIEQLRAPRLLQPHKREANHAIHAVRKWGTAPGALPPGTSSRPDRRVTRFGSKNRDGAVLWKLSLGTECGQVDGAIAGRQPHASDGTRRGAAAATAPWGPESARPRRTSRHGRGIAVSTASRRDRNRIDGRDRTSSAWHR
jgi:hypothetical protein